MLASRSPQTTDRDGNPNNQEVYMADYLLPDGSKYSGYMKKIPSATSPNGFEYQKHGRGEQEWLDGAKYSGDWRLGKAYGKGTFYHANGDIYDGYFVDDRANGEGIYYHKNGSKYVGYWKNDAKDGYGVEQWDDGALYEGNYQEGKKHG